MISDSTNTYLVLTCSLLLINRLECLPYTFRKLTSLKALWLSENQVTEGVPKSICPQFIDPNLIKIIMIVFSVVKYFGFLFQSKPMVPLQSDFDHGTQSHVLTCFMFPQQPPADEGMVGAKLGSLAVLFWYLSLFLRHFHLSVCTSICASVSFPPLSLFFLPSILPMHPSLLLLYLLLSCLLLILR